MPSPRLARFRCAPSLWAAFLTKVSPLPVRVSTSRFGYSVWVETPFAHSEYTFTGGVWALALGPGDERIYRLLTKYLYEIPGDPITHKRWEPEGFFQAKLCGRTGKSRRSKTGRSADARSAVAADVRVPCWI